MVALPEIHTGTYDIFCVCAKIEVVSFWTVSLNSLYRLCLSARSSLAEGLIERWRDSVSRQMPSMKIVPGHCRLGNTYGGRYWNKILSWLKLLNACLVFQEPLTTHIGKRVVVEIRSTTYFHLPGPIFGSHVVEGRVISLFHRCRPADNWGRDRLRGFWGV